MLFLMYHVNCVQDPKIVVASLMKLAGGSPSFANELNVDAFLEQVHGPAN